VRPQRLEVEGFGTFREPTVVDFADIDLAALVGPTGSGKSTVIDALTFALYGSVARYDNPARVAPIIHQLATEARVRLDFELAGRSYIAVRIVRRAKSDRRGTLRASTKEARLEVVEVDGGTTVLAGNVTELDQQVHDLVGLDFAQFTRTIVLPQGEFAELLTDDPSTRQTLIRRLLELDIYARMGGLARERAAAAQQNAGVYQHELSRLDGVTGERLAAAGARIDALDQFSAGAADRLGELAEVDADLARKGDAAERIDRELAAVGQVAVPEGLHEASRQICSKF
jgi:exonuclease SbcC